MGEYKMNYEVVKYNKQWAIFDKKTRCHVIVGGTKKRLLDRVNELNAWQSLVNIKKGKI